MNLYFEISDFWKVEKSFVCGHSELVDLPFQFELKEKFQILYVRNFKDRDLFKIVKG